MTSHDFFIKVECAKDRNGLIYVPAHFNESRIPEYMRYKDFWAERPDDKTYILNWVTMECDPEEHDTDAGLKLFKAEAKRWADANGITGSGVTVIVRLSDNESPWKATFTLD